MIELKNITKTYKNGVKALDNVNLKFTKKELVFITGESGNGKSTLLNIIGCLDRFSSGELFINGLNIESQDQKSIADIRNSYFGFVFQEFYLDDNLSVRENIKLPLEKIDKDSLDEKRLGEDLGISNLFDRSTKELSGGEKQRIQIMRALLKNSEVILADEPTGNLDENTKNEIYKIFKKISSNHLVIIVSHDLEAAKTYADRIINIKNGKIISDDDIKKTTIFVNNNQMNSYELFNYINNQTSDNFSLNIKKVEENQEHLALEDTFVMQSKSISNSFVRKYNNSLFKKNKINFILNIIIMVILLPFVMWLLFFNTYNSKDSINKYLNNNFYNYYVLYNEVEYTNDFYEDLSNRLYSGKKMYNDLISNDLEVNPLINEYVTINDLSIYTNIMYDDTIALNSVEVSDYYAIKNNVKVNDTVIIQNKEYQVSNIFSTDYNKYIDIVSQRDNKISLIKNNIINYHINYIKLNYLNLKSNSLNLPFSNFTLTSFNKYSSTYTTILSSFTINQSLNDNEIIISKSFANRYKLSNDSIGKLYNFIDIRADKYNNYYDNEIALNDYFPNGFIVKDIVEDLNADYYVSNNIFDQITLDYDYYSRPSYYLIKNDNNLNNINGYKFDEININTMYNKEESFNETRILLNVLILSFTLLLIVYNIMYISQILSNSLKSIGLFKSFGFEYKEIKKIYNMYFFRSNISIVLFSSLVYNIIYLIYENIQKDEMLYNKVFIDNYSYIVYIVLLIFIIISILIRIILYKKIKKIEPIDLIR